MEREIANYNARTHWSELLQGVKEGHHYVITHRGEPVAQLLPVESDSKQQRSKHAAEQLLQLMLVRTPVEADIRAMIDEGRD
jgi:prevent-host-death family protein